MKVNEYAALCLDRLYGYPFGNVEITKESRQLIEQRCSKWKIISALLFNSFARVPFFDRDAIEFKFQFTDFIGDPVSDPFYASSPILLRFSWTNMNNQSLRIQIPPVEDTLSMIEIKNGNTTIDCLKTNIDTMPINETLAPGETIEISIPIMVGKI